MLIGESSNRRGQGGSRSSVGRHVRRRAARHAVLVAIAADVGVALCGALLVPVTRLTAGSVGIDDTLGSLRSLSQRSTIVARDGTTSLGVLGKQDRQDVTLREVPQVAREAVIDTEDATFWTNPGVDVAAMARSLL